MSVLYITDPLGEADARLVMVGYAGDGNLQPDSIVREWKHVDATVADKLISELQDDGTEVNPKVDNQTYTGTYVIGKVASIAEDGEKRWVTIREWLYLGNTTPTPYFAGETDSVGRRPATYSRHWPNVTDAQKDTLLGTNAAPGIARSDFAYNDTATAASSLDPEAIVASTYTHYSVVVEEHAEKSLFTVKQTGIIPQTSGGDSDAEPYKVKIVAVGSTLWRVSEYRNYRMSETDARKYAEKAAPYTTFTGGTDCPLNWGSTGAARRNLGSIEKETGGTTYTGIQILWEVDEGNIYDAL